MIEPLIPLALWSLWWVWLAAALCLAIIEIVLPGFIFLGFAIGAALVGILLALTSANWGLPMLLIIFAALSLAAWFVLRRIFRMRDGQVRVIRGDIND